MKRPVRLLALAAAVAAAAAAAMTASPGAASASPGRSVGLLQLAHAAGSYDMTQSNNWSGYDKGVLETGTTFHSISGQWVVPTATQHVKGQDEFSATWLGIGGGCLDTSCTATDTTLIQAGTEQDVAADGTPSYSTWYELIPAPSISTPLQVKPGDTVAVDIAETTPELWSITIKNTTSGQSFNTTVPYVSDYSTAEWIEETPLIIGTGGTGISAMPNLGTVTFDLGMVNGANAALNPAEAMQLVDTNGNVLATPSPPDSDADGFGDCTYASSCAGPSTTSAGGKHPKK
jgi:hypothetical protein